MSQITGERAAPPSDHREAQEIVAQVARERSLSSREHEVLSRTARGESSKQIAYALEISGNTVGYYWARIFRKLGCRSQIAVMTLLFQRALIPLPRD